MQDVLSLILGGGRGLGLYPLTRNRSEPAVPLAGKYRLIDVPVSNCLNSGLNRIYVVTQYLSVSLHRHIANTYKTGPFTRGFVEVLAAQQTNEAANWYLGTADALRQNVHYIEDDDPADVLILSGDQLYRFDFGRLIGEHRSTGADATLAVVPVTRERAPALGIARLDGTRIEHFVEKPSNVDQLEPLKVGAEWLDRHGVPRERNFLGNMGIYMFKRTALLEMLAERPTAIDLVQELLMPSLAARPIHAFIFDGYWDDLGTIRSYHEAHLALASDQPPFDFHSPDGVIYTRSRNLPAARLCGATVSQSLIADGCFVDEGTRIERSLLGVRSCVGRDVTLLETIVQGANDYEMPQQRGQRPPLGVGDGSILERVIVDKNCRIGRNVRLVNRRGIRQEDTNLYFIRDGIIVVPNGTTIPDGTAM
jgi:glucose-1-phosphate adenylyltransferase